MEQMEKVKLVIPGRPVPKKRPRLGVRGRRAYIYTPPETKAYEELIKLLAKMTVKEPLNGLVCVDLKVFVKRPRGDLDNILKSILDGMNGVVYHDDSQVKKIDAELFVLDKETEERAEVEVRRCAGAE